MAQKIRLGVIGSGGRGVIAKWAQDNPALQVEVVACCDVKDSALEQNKEWYGAGVRLTRDYRELLKFPEVDVVIVSSPDYCHEEQALAALEARKPVYLEKPMAITVAGCDRLLVAARRLGVLLFVGHNMRYMNIFRKMKQLIDAGAIGEVKAVWCRHFISYGGDAYFCDWHSERRNTTGLLLQKGAHDLDVIHWLSGRYARKVTAFGSLSVYDRQPRRREGEPAQQKGWNQNDHRYPPTAVGGFSANIDVEDQNMVLMELGDGVMGAYLQCHFTPDACRNYTVIGTEGRLENIGDGPDDPIFLWNRRCDDHYRMIGDQVFRGDPAPAGGAHGGADVTIMEEFLQLVRGECRTPTATMESARMAVAVGCKATESLRSGGCPLEVPPLPETEQA